MTDRVRRRRGATRVLVSFLFGVCVFVLRPLLCVHFCVFRVFCVFHVANAALCFVYFFFFHVFSAANAPVFSCVR